MIVIYPLNFKYIMIIMGLFFDITEGIIPVQSNVRVNATFRPYETIIYYQRVFFLIRNHSLFPIDLFGSCHGLIIKTPLLDMKQID